MEGNWLKGWITQFVDLPQFSDLPKFSTICRFAGFPQYYYVWTFQGLAVPHVLLPEENKSVYIQTWCNRAWVCLEIEKWDPYDIQKIFDILPWPHHASTFLWSDSLISGLCKRLCTIDTFHNTSPMHSITTELMQHVDVIIHFEERAVLLTP